MNSTDSIKSLLAASGGDTVKLFDISVEPRDPCILNYTPSPGFHVNSIKWNHTSEYNVHTLFSFVFVQNGDTQTLNFDLLHCFISWLCCVFAVLIFFLNLNIFCVDLVVASAGDDKKISLWMKNGQSLGTIPVAGSDTGDNIEVISCFSTLFIYLFILIE